VGDVSHLKGSPLNPDRIYASQCSGWFGQIIQRSDDGGRTWAIPGGGKIPEAFDPPSARSNRFLYSGEVGTHAWYDGTQHPWEFKRVWHLEPSLTEPDTVFAGVEDAALFKSTDGGMSWNELPGLRNTKGALWQPGAGGMCLHTIIQDPRDPQRLFVAISAAGAFRTDDGGASWRPINRGLNSPYELPDPDAEVGHCVHRIALHPSRPDTLFMQKHWDVMRTDNAGDDWREVSGNLPSDFGFPIDVHAHEAETIYVVPINSDSLHYPPEGKLRVRLQRRPLRRTHRNPTPRTHHQRHRALHDHRRDGGWVNLQSIFEILKVGDGHDCIGNGLDFSKAVRTLAISSGISSARISRAMLIVLSETP